MKLFKDWESRKKLKSERDFYKQKYLDECEYSASLKQEADDADQNSRQLKEENDRLKEENLAKKNIISENNIKAKKQKAKIDQMQRRIDSLEAKLNPDEKK